LICNPSVMKKSLLSQLSRIMKYGKKFGVGGLSLAMKINSPKPGVISGILKDYKYPVFLRNESSDVHVFSQVIYEQEYDIKYRVNPTVILDCGANIGLSTIFFKNKFPEATIISVEPERSNFNLLQINTERYPNIHCLNYGIWNRSTHLKIKDNSRGNWGFTVEETDKQDPDTIEAISIDEVMRRYQLNHIDILKIDIEGSEQKLFESNTEKWLPFVKVIVIELHDKTVKDCAKTFYKALENYEYETKTHRESIICYLKQN
jgi:FkbM family methyltransferase